jgi:hypothetical protein
VTNLLRRQLLAVGAQRPHKGPFASSPATDRHACDSLSSAWFRLRSSLVAAEYKAVGTRSAAAWRPALSCASAIAPRSADVAGTAHCHVRFRSAHRRASQKVFLRSRRHALLLSSPAGLRFFDNTAFSASRSKACCATILFSRPFSSSRVFNRRASFSSNPPYLVFQR